MSAPTRRALTIDDPVAGATRATWHAPGAEAAAGRLREIPLDEIHPEPRPAAQALRRRRRSARWPTRSASAACCSRSSSSPRSAGGYQLIAGERRWRASQVAGRRTIPALVDDPVDGAGSLELALIENVAREDLTVIEEARTIASLLDDLHVTAARLARRLGRSRSDLAHTVRLLDLPDDGNRTDRHRRSTKGHGKALLD